MYSQCVFCTHEMLQGKAASSKTKIKPDQGDAVIAYSKDEH